MTTLNQRLTTLALVLHRANPGLDPITTLDALVHDAVHGATGLGVSLEDEHLVLNIVEILQGGEALPQYHPQCEQILCSVNNADLMTIAEGVQSIS